MTITTKLVHGTAAVEVDRALFVDLVRYGFDPVANNDGGRWIRSEEIDGKEEIVIIRRLDGKLATGPDDEVEVEVLDGFSGDPIALIDGRLGDLVDTLVTGDALTKPVRCVSIDAVMWLVDMLNVRLLALDGPAVKVFGDLTEFEWDRVLDILSAEQIATIHEGPSWLRANRRDRP